MVNACAQTTSASRRNKLKAQMVIGDMSITGTSADSAKETLEAINREVVDILSTICKNQNMQGKKATLNSTASFRNSATSVRMSTAMTESTAPVKAELENHLSNLKNLHLTLFHCLDSHVQHVAEMERCFKADTEGLLTLGKTKNQTIHNQ